MGNLSIERLAMRLGAMDAVTEFFYENAGASCKPPQTWAEGTLEGALKLAAAETWARRNGYRFHWTQCDTTSQEFSSRRPFYPLQACCLVDPEGRLDWAHSLHGIDFGRENPEPHGAYVRVVEAELALDAMP
jgi:hypothetical protein